MNPARAFSEEEKLRGLNYARSINFTDEQYEKALERVSSPMDANQLLLALIDVCNTAKQNDGNMGRAHQKLCKSASSSSHVSSYSSVDQRPSSNGSSSEQSIASFSNQSSMSSSSMSSSQPDLMQRSETSVDNLKPIFIDGSNVARTHGKEAYFSWPGIKYCVDWFCTRHHKVKVLVPEDRCRDVSSEDEFIIDYLNRMDALVKTPKGHNDDLFIIEAAFKMNGVIVSNDMYREEKRRLGKDGLDQFIYLNRLPYIFVGDLFMPADDPRGRLGPRLDEFLRKEPAIGSSVSVYGCSDRSNRDRWNRCGRIGHYQANSRQQSEHYHYLYLIDEKRQMTLPEKIRRSPRPEQAPRNQQVQSSASVSLISTGRTNNNRKRNRSAQLPPQSQRPS